MRRGLFVAALDRPWLGTRFLFQGFLIQSDDEIQALQEACSWVVVDLARSNADATHGLTDSAHDRRAGPADRRHGDPADASARDADAGQAKAANPGGEGDAASKKSRRIQELMDRYAGYFTVLPDNERPGEIPLGEPLVRYVAPTGAPRHRASQAAKIAKDARGSLARLARDIVEKGELHLDEIEATATDLTASIIENPGALAWLVQARKTDTSTYMHNVTAAVYLLTFGRHLGYPPPRLVMFAMIGLLLDIGKLFVDRALLDKAGPLAEDELVEVQKHVELGLAALSSSGDLDPPIIDGIAQHHEWVDGTGYPNGLAGTAIGMEGKLAAIVDSFTAMTSPRAYAPSLTAYQAMRELYRHAGTHFQESLIDKFVQAVGIFPVGSIVELSGGELAVVVRQNQQRRLEPCVLVLTDGERRRLEAPQEIDLLTQSQLSIEHKLTRISRSVPPGEVHLDLSQLYLC